MHKVTRPALYFILLVFCALQVTLLGRFKVFTALPDLMLIPVVFTGLFSGSSRGMEIGIAGGLLKDMFALDIFPINTITFGLTGFAAGFLDTKFLKESKASQFILTFIFTALSMYLHYIMETLVSRPANMGLAGYTVSSVVPTGVYTALIAMPVFSKLISMYGLEEGEEFL